MNPKAEFLQRELAWVRVVRKTKRPDQAHLVTPAANREREILAELRHLGEGTVQPPMVATKRAVDR